MNNTFKSELSIVSGSGGKFFGFECDLEKEGDIRNLFDQIEKHPELGHVDVCICNAGINILCISVKCKSGWMTSKTKN